MQSIQIVTALEKVSFLTVWVTFEPLCCILETNIRLYIHDTSIKKMQSNHVVSHSLNIITICPGIWLKPGIIFYSSMSSISVYLTSKQVLNLTDPHC